MDKDGFEVELKELFEKFGEALNKYEGANPEWEIAAFGGLVYNAILSLKTHIEDPEEKEITWENPVVELQYPVEMDWENLQPLVFKVTGRDLLDVKKINEILTEGFLKTRDMYIFRALCNDTALLKEGDSETLLPSTDLIEKLEKLPERTRRKTLKAIEAQVFGYDLKTKDRKGKPASFPVKDITFSLPIKGGGVDSRGKERRFEAVLFFDFSPLILDKEARKAYYPVIVGLEFLKGYQPTGWTEEERRGLWETILTELKTYTPEEKLSTGEGALTLPTFEVKGEGRAELPEPTVRAVSPGTALVRASLHLEKQKFGKKPLPYGIQDVIGIDLTQAQGQALFAIQRLLQETEYRGNLPPEPYDGNNIWKFSGKLPVLKFSPAQYLEAFGVKKYQTARGYMEFSGEERKDALKALIDLAIKQHIFVYKRVYWEKTKKGQDQERINRIETIDTLIKISRGWEALTKQEDSILDNGKTTRGTDDKLKVIFLSPCPILVDQIDTYFSLKRATCYQEIRLLIGYASKYVYHFVDFLLAEVAQREIKSKGKGNQNWTIERSPETLAYNLRMNTWLKKKQWKQIRESLKKCYETAQKLGYLTGYEMDVKGKTTTLDRLILNPEKFRRMREIAEERKKLDIKPALPPT
jgi:hypothetical protein